MFPLLRLRKSVYGALRGIKRGNKRDWENSTVGSQEELGMIKEQRAIQEDLGETEVISKQFLKFQSWKLLNRFPREPPSIPPWKCSRLGWMGL